jgi:hypothetical protein
VPQLRQEVAHGGGERRWLPGPKVVLRRRGDHPLSEVRHRATRQRGELRGQHEARSSRALVHAFLRPDQGRTHIVLKLVSNQFVSHDYGGYSNGSFSAGAPLGRCYLAPPDAVTRAQGSLNAPIRSKISKTPRPSHGTGSSRDGGGSSRVFRRRRVSTYRSRLKLFGLRAYKGAWKPHGVVRALV